MPTDFNQRIIDEFRANRGRVGGPFEGARLILLTTTGARSGAPHTTPLAYLPDEVSRILVIASAGGAPRHPHWYRNLLAHPRVTVETGLFTYPADAAVLRGEERDRAFARATEAQPAWAEYETKAARTLPVVALAPATAGPPSAGGLGATLVATHEAFRRELRLIRAEARAAGPRLGAQLRVNCLTFCQGLENHHAGEDTMMFPFLERDHPALAGPLAELRKEHEVVKRLLEELHAVLAAEDPDPAALAAETDRLITALEDHLDHEEARLLPVLNGLGGLTG